MTFEEMMEYLLENPLITAASALAFFPSQSWSPPPTDFALFDKTLLLEAVEENDEVELQVEGKLKTDQYFTGSNIVRIKLLN